MGYNLRLITQEQFAILPCYCMHLSRSNGLCWSTHPDNDHKQLYENYFQTIYTLQNGIVNTYNGKYLVHTYNGK